MSACGAVRPGRRLLLVLALAAWSGCRSVGEGDIPLAWPGSDAYRARVASLPISPDAARALLVAKTRDRPASYFDSTPTFLAGDEYFFTSELSRTAAPLQGFFVNGRSGAIEYRETAIAVEAHQRALPENAFTQITPIDGQSGVRFFRTFDAIRLPYRPYDEVTEAETHDLEAFIRCAFDSQGRVTRLEKFYQGRPHFTHEYRYHPNGQLREVVVRELWPREAPVRIETFDEQGRPAPMRGRTF